MATVSPEVVRIPLGQLQANCYLVICPETHAALAIDPADEPERIVQEARRKGARIEQVLLTHAHMDHVWGLEGLRRATGAILLSHPDEAAMAGRYARLFGLPPESLPELTPDVPLKGGEEISIGQLTATPIHTPGHWPGGLTLRVGEFLFTGDTLFAQGVGRTDLPGGDFELLMQSIRELFTLPDETIVYPGHGPDTTIGVEKRENPYVE